jgi:hypothetical protein
MQLGPGAAIVLQDVDDGRPSALYPTISPSTAADVAGLPAPVGAETASMPTDHGLRLDDDDRVQERRVQSIQPHQEQAIDVPQPLALIEVRIL